MDLVTMTLLGFLAIAIVIAAGAYFTITARREGVWNSYHHTPHENGRIARVAEADFPVLFLLAKKGTAAGSMTLCDAASEPIGPCLDKPATGESGTVSHLGADSGTKTVIASKAIAENTRVYATAGGKVTDAVVSGAYLVGKTTTDSAAGDGDELEIVPCFPVENP